MYIYLLHNQNDAVSKNETFKISRDDQLQYLFEGDEKLELEEGEKVFEVMDAEYPLRANAFVVFNNVPVIEEGRGIFEERFKNRLRKVENEPGFIAIRVCRPLNSDTYVTMIFWETEDAFENWRKSEAYQEVHTKRGTEEGIDQKHANIFPRPSYMETFNISS